MNGSEDAVGSSTLWPTYLKLSLVIPAYNEGMRLEAGVSRLLVAIESGAIDAETTEFVVVDDGSTDDTTRVARALFAAFPHVQHIRLAKNGGKGGAVRSGVAAARAPLIAFADADMAIDPAQTPQFTRALHDSSIAIGSRSASGASVNRPSLRRSIMNRAFNRLVNALTRVSLDDTQCGFKAFRAPVGKLLFHCSVTERFAFDVEVLSLARRLGFSIAEVPVRWLRVKGSQIRPLKDARSMARDVVRAGRGTAWAPPVPTLHITPAAALVPGTDGAASLAGLRRSLAPWLPVLETTDGRLSVLCPQMEEPQIAATAAWITTQCEGAIVERATLTVTQLSEMAPLLLAAGDEAVAREPAEVHPVTVAAKRART
jgi:Glycosyl transferase family 2